MRFHAPIAFAAAGLGLLAFNLPAFAIPLPRERPPRAEPRMVVAPRQVRPDGFRPQSHIQPAVAASRPLFGSPSLVAEARKYLGTNPTDRKKLWCATFMNFVLRKAGYEGTHSDAAKSFVSYGRRIARPQVGAIAVLTRGRHGGHVGIVSGIDPDGNPIIISGNHNRRVGVSVYPRSRVIAYVLQTHAETAREHVGARTGGEPTLESPIAELLAAIDAEQEARRASVRRPPAQAAAPRRTVQQLPVTDSGSRRLPLAPALAELVGVADGGQQFGNRRF
jgi:uncharacterized protein (TIGR02594 family)